jgi:hypothetical protein
MTLPKETIERINKDANKMWTTDTPHIGYQFGPKQRAYIFGRCQEAERARVLVEALEKIGTFFPNVDNAKDMKRIAIEALSSYNKTQEDGI